MAIYEHKDLVNETVLRLAADMANAARTAPKTRGVDRLHIAVIDGDTMTILAQHMKKMHAEGRAADHFVRDADNLLASNACVLIGTETAPMPGGCKACGMTTCVNQKEYVGALCTFAVHDLGLAIGSAVSLAADHRVDNRVMFSVGAAAIEIGMLPGGVKAGMGIPLSATGKSPYYDRKPKI